MVNEKQDRDIEELKRQLREADTRGSDLDFERNEVASNLEELREQFNGKMKCKDEEIERLVCEAQESVDEMKRFSADVESQRGQMERQLLEARQEIEHLRSDNSKEVNWILFVHGMSNGANGSCWPVQSVVFK